MLVQFKKYAPFILTGVFFVSIFFLSYDDPRFTADALYHIKAGQYFLAHGLTSQDPFSFVTKGREWYNFEWLFQIILARLYLLGGFSAVAWLVCLETVGIFAGIFALSKWIFRLPILLALGICALTATWTYDINIPRPQTMAFVFLVWNLFFILLYIIRRKNLLWITLPITFLWTNMHGTIILNVYFFVIYTLVCISLFYTTKDKVYKTQSKVLAIYTIITILITIAPPLWTTQYRQLILFSKYKAIRLINEWRPLTSSTQGYLFPFVTIVLVTCTAVWATALIRYKSLHSFFLSLPIFVFVPLVYIALRNKELSFLSGGILLAWAASLFLFKEGNRKWKKIILLIISSIAILHFAWLCYAKGTYLYNLPANAAEVIHPKEAAVFIKNEHVQGNMYHAFDDGMYLLFELYPQQKVFFDGRADLYLCCEMQEIAVINHYAFIHDDDALSRAIDQLFNDYSISFALLNYKEKALDGAIARKLSHEKNWSLVYWDDKEVIFVKNDGKNDSILTKFKADSVDLFSQKVYKPGQQEQALQEYQRLAEKYDSVVTEIGIIAIAYEKKDVILADTATKKAMRLDPSNPDVYLLAGETYFSFQKYPEAIDAYKRLLALDKTQYIPYARLAQIYNNVNHNSFTAQTIVKEGIKNVTNEKDKEQLQNILTQLNSL